MKLRWLRKVILPVGIVLLVIAGSGLADFWQTTTAEPVQTHFERAVAFVRDEAAGVVPNRGPEDSRFRFYAALSAMNYLQANLSSARYNFLSRLRKEQFRPPGGTEACLTEGIGICGNHIQAFLDIMEALAIPARPVQLYFEDSVGERQNHIVAEVEWGGRWHMFDVTWSFIALGEDSEPLSYTEARAGKPYRASLNHNNPWFYEYAQKIDLFEYINFEKGDVIIDDNGVVRPYIQEHTAERIKYGLLHLPNYIGTVVDADGKRGTLVYEVELPRGFDVLTLSAQGSACPEPVKIAANGVAKPVQSGTVEFSGLRGTVRLTANEIDRTCYVVLKDIVATGTGRSMLTTN